MSARSRRERWVAGAVVALVVVPWIGVGAWFAAVAATAPTAVEAWGRAIAENTIAEFGPGAPSDPSLPLATFLTLLLLFAHWAAMQPESELAGDAAFVARPEGVAIGLSVGMLAGFVLDALFDIPGWAIFACLAITTLAFGARRHPGSRPCGGFAG